MNKRIFYAVLPLAATVLSAGANAQGVVTERWPQQAQDQQTTVYRTTVRENAVPQMRPAARKQSKQIRQSRQIVRTPSGNVVRTTTTERIVTRPAPIARAPLARERVITAPTTFVTADPLDLTPDQRTMVYRTLVQPSVQPAPIVTQRIVRPGTRPFVTTEPLMTTAPVERRVITVPQTTGMGTIVTNEPFVDAPGALSEIAIGSRIPASVPLYLMPASAAVTAPSIGTYHYALIGDRVYFVDPRDGIVVGMLYQ